MPAFGTNTANMLVDTVGAVHVRLKATNPQPILTPANVVELLAPPKLRDALINFSAYADVYRSSAAIVTKVQWPALQRYIQFHFIQSGTGAATTPFLPKYPALQPDADERYVEAITKWALRAVDIAVECGRLRALIHELNTVCCSPVQFRYVFPSVLALFKLAPLNPGAPENLVDFREPRNMPPITPAIRTACRQCAATVTTAMLVGAPEGEPGVEREVLLNVLDFMVEEPIGKFGAYV